MVIIEIGYAVNHTDAFSIAARGSGLANGFCHMLPWPENCLANSTASDQHRLLGQPVDVVGVVAVGLAGALDLGSPREQSAEPARGRSRFGRAG